MKWIMSVLLGATALFTVYLMVFEFPEKQPTEQNQAFEVPDLPVDAEAAQSVYKSNCMSCHGEEFQGKNGPGLKTVGTTMTKEEIYKKVMKGGGIMPAFEGKLPEEEVINLTNWLATFK
ncbi:c-type cytochrome [Paenibacillus yanchengensis]|uniref:C-type cytochrome n=1 Tax=Paenibacillus yanchengensis TaxID=2035833 RepID=A0ABW4YQT1_9BACL